MQNLDKTTKLSNHSIDEISRTLIEFMKETKTEHATALRIHLSIEEALLRFRDHFGPEQEIHVFIGRRLHRYMIQIGLSGEAYNPLVLKDDTIDNWSSSLLSSIGISPNYYYANGRNNLRLVLPGKVINPVYMLLICVALGMFFGIFGRMAIPESIIQEIIDGILQPIFNLWMRTLLLLSGPLIFVLVLTTILNMSNISVQGGDKRRIVIRYVLLSTAIGILTILVMRALLPLPETEFSLTAGNVSGLLDVLFGIVPEDMIEPFISVNTAQLVFMALCAGNAISLLAGGNDTIVSFVKQCYEVGLMLADWVGKAVPFFAVTLMTLAIWTDGERLFSQMWIVFAVFLILSLIYSGATLMRAAMHWHMPLRSLIGKLKTSFLITMRTGSLNEAYTYIEKGCIRSLGIQNDYAKATLPSGLVLYMPISAAELIIFSLYAAWIYRCPTDFGWYFLLLFLTVVLSMASPPVAGISLISFMTIFSQLDIPSQALVGGMIADIVLGIAASAFNQMMLQLELLIQAERLGLVNSRILMDEGKKE